MFRRLLFRLDPEDAHGLVLNLLRLAGALPPVRAWLRAALPRGGGWPVQAMGLEFANPIGLAAGYDKDGLALHGLACLGFGHIEVGTVTPEPQAGNPRPRVFRLVEDWGLINRMGFPNRGAAALARRLERRPSGVVIGVSLGKAAGTPLEAAAKDYCRLVHDFHSLADYLVVNVSSPNTPGLRRLQDAPALEALLLEIQAEADRQVSPGGRRVPLLAKLSPDLSETELSRAVEAACRARLDGLVATNTTVVRTGLRSPASAEAGGLSGKPLRQRATQVVRDLVREAGGRLVIVAGGGISDAASAAEKLDAGAALIQVFTGLVYRGPGLVGEILRGLPAARRTG